MTTDQRLETSGRLFVFESQVSSHKSQVVFKKITALITAFAFAGSMCITPVMAETINLEGGSVEVNVQDNTTNWNVTGNPIWNMPEFNVAQGSTYNIAGLGSGASLALLVNGGNASNIFGTMNLSNLDFILQNIAGINIGSSSMINLNNASLIASTIPLNLNATDFFNRQYFFEGQGGFLMNEGKIVGNNSDLVALVGNAIENRGVIEVPMGTVALAAGDTVAVGISPDGMVTIGVDPATANELGLADQIKNSGTISAQGGRVVLSAKAIDGLFDKAINLTAESNAVSVVRSDDGVIEFVAQGDISNAGTVQAQRGQIKVNTQGDVENSGMLDTDTGTIVVDAGTTGTVSNSGTIRTKLFDEKGYSFRSTGNLFGGSEGGKYQYANVDGAANLSGNIGADQSDIGNLIVNAAGITLTVDNLTFTADSNNNGNGIFTMEDGATLTGGGFNLTIFSGQNRSTYAPPDVLTDDSAGAENSHFEIVSGVNRLTLSSSNEDMTTYDTDNARGFSITTMKTNYGTVFTRNATEVIGSVTYQLIYSVSDAVGGLQFMDQNLSGKYKLANNIDASETASWNAGAGFDPVGNNGAAFSGFFEGNSKTITGLTINRSGEDYVGLFGYASGSTIQNVGLVGGDVSGYDEVGGLVGRNESSSNIANSYVTGSVGGHGSVGGLVGYNISSTITNSFHSGGAVNGGGFYTGGLIGYNNDSTITSSYVTGCEVRAHSTVGGLVGRNESSVIVLSYFTGSVDASGDEVGGLVGTNVSSTIDASYSTGSVAGDGNYVGGLVGWNTSGDIANSYASGSVMGDVYNSQNVGGLVGWNGAGSSITNAYSESDVRGRENVGGLVGHNTEDAGVTNSFSTGVTTSTGDTAGGFIGNYESGTLTNNWWYNATPGAVGVGNAVPAGVTMETDGAAAFYKPTHEVYAIGTEGQWDIFGADGQDPVWDTFSNDLPHLRYEGLTVNVNPLWLGTTSSDWNTDANWYGGHAPGTGDVVAIINSANPLNLPKDDLWGISNYIGGFIMKTGTVTQNNGLIINGDYIQLGGTFTSADPLANPLSVSGGFTIPDAAGAFNRYGAAVPVTTLDDQGNPQITNYYMVRDLYDLQAMKGHLSSNFMLDENLDASATDHWNYDPTSGDYLGFDPIGNAWDGFTSIFDGNSRTITGLTINRGSEDYVGLFRWALGATIRNVGLVGGSVRGKDFVGDLVGVNFASITHSYATGSVSGAMYVGGLIGCGNSAGITNSYATGSVSGTRGVGGLVGLSETGFSIINSYSTGSVSGTEGVGGLVGYNNYSSITNSYATGSTTGTSNVGGLIGVDDSGILTNNWWSNALANGFGNSGPNEVVGQYQITSAASDFYNPGHAVYDPYNAGGNHWDFDEGGNGSATWVPVVERNDFDFEIASYPILGWQSEAVHMSGAETEVASGTEANPYLITNVGQLQLMIYDLDAHYQLSNEINADVDGYNTHKGFRPIGEWANPFSGTLDGNAQKIKKLTMNRPDEDYTGFFGVFGASAEAYNMEILDVHVEGKDHSGALAGWSAGKFWNISISGPTTVIGVNFVGGFVGTNAGSLTNMSTRVNVIGSGSAGNDSVGLAVGQNTGTMDQVFAAYATLTSNGAGGVLVGSGAGIVTRSFYDLYNSGRAEASGPGTAAKVPRMIADGVDEFDQIVMIYDPAYLADTSPDLMNYATYAAWDNDFTSANSTWVIDNEFSLPALRSVHPDGIIAAWGNAYDVDTGDPLAGKSMDLYINNVNPSEITGQLLGTTKTSATGNYYFDMDPGEIQSADSYVTAKLQDEVFDGRASMLQGTKSMPGLNVPGDRADIISNPYREVPIPIPSNVEQLLEQAEAALNRSLANIMSSMSREAESLQGNWNSAADVQIQDETFSVTGTEWVDEQELDLPMQAAITSAEHSPSISFYENLEPGKEPVPIYTVTQVAAGTTFFEPGNVKSVMLEIASEGLQSSSDESTSGEGKDGKFSVASGVTSGGGSGSVSEEAPATSHEQVTESAVSSGDAPSENNEDVAAGAASEKSGPSEAESVAMDEASLLSGDETQADELSSEETTPSIEGGLADAEGSDNEVSSAMEEQEQAAIRAAQENSSQQAEEEARDHSDAFQSRRAENYSTDVLVIEGSVFVLDGVNEMSLLGPGEALRVNFKSSKPDGQPFIAAPRVATVAKKDPPKAVVSDTDPLRPVIRDDSAGSQKKDPPQAMVSDTYPLRPVVKNDRSETSVRDDASALADNLPARSSKKDSPALAIKADSPAMPVPPSPKEVAEVGLPSAKELARTGVWFGTLQNTGKNVFVKCRGGQWQAAKDGMVILSGDEVRTSSQSSVEVLLAGGNVGRVLVQEGSLFRISKAETDPVTGDKRTLLDLAIGKVLVHAETLKGKSRFEVKTPTALTGVRGTTFTVEVKEKS